MSKITDKEHKEKVEKLHKEYPDIPIEIFDIIEASEEMASLYYDEFGY